MSTSTRRAVVPLAVVTLITLVTFALGTQQAISINSDQSIAALATAPTPTTTPPAPATASKSEISSTAPSTPLMNSSTTDVGGGSGSDSPPSYQQRTTQVIKNSNSPTTTTTLTSSISASISSPKAPSLTTTIRKPQPLQSGGGGKQQQSSSNGRVRRPQTATVRSSAATSSTRPAPMDTKQQRPARVAAGSGPDQLSYDPIQDEIRRMMAEYRNTPPLFVTSTRDFFVDVASYPLGFKLTTMQALDSEGDRIEYSLKPANYRDASPYFSINSTSGELRLANKRIPVLHSASGTDTAGELQLLASDNVDAAANEEGDEEDDDNSSSSSTRTTAISVPANGDGASGRQLVRSVAELQQQDSFADQDKPGYLYFLNVAANDGKYTSVVELQIHVFNSTSFGTKSPVQLTVEGGRRSGEQLMRAKTAEFFDKLYSPPSSSPQAGAVDNSTLVFPSFVNPGLIVPNSQEETTSTIDDASSANEPPPTTIGSFNSSPATVAVVAPPPSGKFSSAPVASLPYVEPAAHLDNNRQHADVLHQPMMLSLVIIICSCFTVALVLLIFVVPLSVKRLKKRLKNMELQHEQLSKKDSNGGSSIVCSQASSTSGRSMTISSASGSRHLPSLSQFTLAGSDRSRAGAMLQMPASQLSSNQHQRLPIGRQSSLDSAITSGHFASLMVPTSVSSYNSQSVQYHQQQQQAAAANMHLQAHIGDNNFLHHNHPHLNHNHHNNNHHHHHQLPTITNGLNRINNGAIVNPVYLHQHHNQMRRLQHDNSTHSAATGSYDAKAPFSVTDSDNIYCPIDDELYSTINTESTTIGDGCSVSGKNYAMNNQADQHQQHQLGMIGSLVGQTFDSRNYFASQCAPQQLNLDVSTGGGAGGTINVADQRDTDTPNSTSSSSSTRMLARFLSLPARHWSHEQQRDEDDTGADKLRKRKQNSFLEELESCFKETATSQDQDQNKQQQHNRPTTALDKQFNGAMNADLGAAANLQAAQTIARANHIAQEQQVREGAKSDNIKRHKTSFVAANIERQQQSQPHVWELARHKLRFLDILDEGQFGLVWRCKLKKSTDGANCGRANSSHTKANDSDNWTMKGTEQTVAVKMLKSSVAKDEREREDLLAEIEIMKLVCNHPNVVKILHCCTQDISQTKPILLVMEHVELGKLQSFLEKSRASHNYATVPMASSLYNHHHHHQQATTTTDAGDAYYCDDESSTTTTVYEDSANATSGRGSGGPMMRAGQHQRQRDQLTSRELIKFIYHVAKGMEYISSQLIVHRDLASRNILIDSQRVCKLGDFGMARHMANQGDVYERHSRNTKIPVRWMAPEVLLNNSFTTKSDVYSFGILMWEIVTLGSTPYRHLKTEEIVDAVARLGERPSRPDYCHALLYNIMSRCWSAEPSERPSFMQLVQQLDELLLSTNEYIELDQYPDHNYYNIAQAAAPLELL